PAKLDDTQWRPSSRGAPRRLTIDLILIIVLPERTGHPSPEVFATLEFALSLRGLKGTGSTTDLFRPGGPSRGEEPAACRPAMRDTSSRRRYRSWATTCSAALRMDLSPRPENASLVTQRGPQPAGRTIQPWARKARTAPTGEVGTARALSFVHRRHEGEGGGTP